MLHQRRRSVQMPLLRERIAPKCTQACGEHGKNPVRNGTAGSWRSERQSRSGASYCAMLKQRTKLVFCWGDPFGTQQVHSGGVVELETGVVTVHPRNPLETVINDLEKLLHLITWHGENLIELIQVVWVFKAEFVKTFDRLVLPVNAFRTSSRAQMEPYAINLKTSIKVIQ